ncbi:MAG: hypothetical protein LUE14_04880 [Clostridiales bacterium]|nr:hypothetical protein [Clostridiales bacterium]
MMKKNRTFRFVAFLLAAALCLSMISSSAFATEATGSYESASDVIVSEETDSYANGSDVTVPEETDSEEDADALISSYASTSDNTDENSESSESESMVVYSGHAQTYGDLTSVADGAVLGTTGQSKRLEAISISKGTALSDVDGSIQYRVHVQSYGTLDWVSDVASAGTTGESKRIEAIQIRLTGELSEQYDIYYSMHVQKYGWTNWTKGLSEADSVNGTDGWCGTNGLYLRVEAIQVILVEKGGEAPTSSGSWSYLTWSDMGNLTYSGHQQSAGNLSAVSNGSVLGSAGSGKRLEAVSLSVSGASVSGGITYRTHLQTYGWQSWSSDGSLSGTTGQSKRMEAIEIKLTGNLANYCDVWYKVYVEQYGWLGWATNGQTAGTTGISYQIEAVQIQIVPKAAPTPGENSGYYKDTPKMSAADQRIYNSVVAVYNSVGKDLYACFKWVVNNMTYERINGHLTPPTGYTRCQWYAVKAFETHQGNCYCYAAAFYYLAIYLGYDAEYVEGQVTKRGGGYTPHGWVVIDGAYICDPEGQAEISPSLNFYMQPINNTLLTYVR